MSLRRLWLCLLLSCPLAANELSELISLANTQNPQAQYQLALAYQTGHSVTQNQHEAFYWFLQAAEQQHPAAMAQVANSYMTGQGVEPDALQTQYWLTQLALSGNIRATTTLAAWYQQQTAPISTFDLAEIWYRVHAKQDPQAEQGYADLLEQKFNQQREKQLNSIAQFDQLIDQDLSSPATTHEPTNQQDTQTNWWPFTLSILSLLMMALIIVLHRHWPPRHRRLAAPDRELHTQLQAQQLTIKRQKQQLDQLLQTCQRLQQQSYNADQQKMVMALAQMGFEPTQSLDIKSVKLRYKQLSKIYHPDLGGSEQEMKRLNGAVKMVINSLHHPQIKQTE
ncbi:MAG: molecular chaperone DnaJ [Vibrio sp.]